MLILALESSCDETSCAILKNGTQIISHTLASSAEIHQKTGGVVPEVAARKQVEYILPVIEQTVTKAISKLCLESFEDFVKTLDFISVTVGPGLIGSLLVGVEAAKALAVAWNKPLIPVNHLVGHIYANFINSSHLIEFPALVLVVSGGHTDLVLMKDHGNLSFIGSTLDDAVGEAYDKSARLLNIQKYLGGLALSNLGRAHLLKLFTESAKFNGDIEDYNFLQLISELDFTYKGVLPRSKINDKDFDFSFSGLKSSVKRFYDLNSASLELSDNLGAFCLEFESAVVEVLVSKTLKAAQEFNANCILLGGGVSANASLRNALKYSASIPVYFPPLELCGDNAMYIGCTAYFNNTPVNLNYINANPALTILD